VSTAVEGEALLLIAGVSYLPQVAVKVIDIFGNDTMTLVPVNVG
jgi:hypothetical protein